MFAIGDIPGRMHLCGALAPLGVCVVQESCYNTIKINGFNLGSDRAKLLKTSYQNYIFFDSVDMNQIYKKLNKILSRLALIKEISPQKRSNTYFAVLQNLIEKYADKAINDNPEYKFASLCLPFNLNGEYPMCKCGQHGAMSLLSLIDNQGVHNEY